MTYLRFVVSKVHRDSGVNDGVFETAYALRDGGEVTEADRQALVDLLSWFVVQLPTPERFNRSSSKGYYRRATRGISWFRDTAHEHISRMYELKRLTEAYGHSVEILREDRIGYVVYEDAFQVVAEPFADTQTSA